MGVSDCISWLFWIILLIKPRLFLTRWIGWHKASISTAAFLFRSQKRSNIFLLIKVFRITLEQIAAAHSNKEFSFTFDLEVFEGSSKLFARVLYKAALASLSLDVFDFFFAVVRVSSRDLSNVLNAISA